MPRPIRRSLAALGLSLSLALGAVVAPAPALAEADRQQLRLNDGAGAAIAALIALGVIAAIIDDDDDDDDRRDRARDDRRERVQVHRRGPDRYYEDGRFEDGRVLSAECVRHVRGGQRVLAGECLERRGHHARLPGHCRSQVYAGGRYRPVYDMRCLRGAGYYVR